MGKIRTFVISIIIMLTTSVLSLLLISTLSYFFKWHADQAMIGIIATYILAGFVGGFCFKRLEKKRYADERRTGRKAMEALSLGGIFMLILLLASTLLTQNTFAISARFLMILGLNMSSTFLGRIL